MRRNLIAAAALLAVTSGSALAQNANPGGAMGTTNPTTTDTMQRSQSGIGGQEQLASAEKLLGKAVYGADNQKVGDVADVILDAQNGQARQLVISSGGFLGIGEKQIAVDFNQAKWNDADNRVHLSGLTQAEVRNLPEFKYSDTMTSLNRNRSNIQPSK